MPEPHVIASRTTLVLPFQWDASARTPDEWASLALSRQLPKRRADKPPCGVWQVVDIGRAPRNNKRGGTVPGRGGDGR